VPDRIQDPDKFGFFDPLTGNAKVWFWVSETGEYEFYNGPGFHPKSGDPLKLIDRDAIATWKKAVQAAADRQKREEDRKAQEARDQFAAKQAALEAQKLADQKATEELEKQKQAALEAKKLADEKAADELQNQQKAGLDCDRLAANPTDQSKAADGVNFDALRLQADAAFDACTKAVSQFPSEQRFQYQLGRAAQFKDTKKAFEIFTALTNSGYPAAFDNLGGMYQDKNDIGTATRFFKAGVNLGDADSMFSLARLIEKGYYSPPNAVNFRLALLKRSADLGNADAQQALEIEYQKAQNAQQQQLMQQQIQQQMLNIFGAAVQGAMRR